MLDFNELHLRGNLRTSSDIIKRHRNTQVDIIKWIADANLLSCFGYFCVTLWRSLVISMTSMRNHSNDFIKNFAPISLNISQSQSRIAFGDDNCHPVNWNEPGIQLPISAF